MAKESSSIPEESLNVDPQKLFKWIMRETARENYSGPAEEENEEVTRLTNLSAEEKRKWMNALFGDPSKRLTDAQKLKLCLTSLDVEKLTDEEADNLLQNLHFLCEFPHVSAHLPKVGGLDIVFRYCEHSNESVREQAAWILHTCSSNNPRFKCRFTENNGFDRLFKLVKAEKSFIVQKKHLGTFTNLIRQYDVGLKLFLKKDGIDIILMFLKDQGPHVYLRSIRILNEIILSNHLNLKHLEDMGIVDIILKGLEHKEQNIREEILEMIEILGSSENYRTVVPRKEILSLLPSVLKEAKVSCTEEYYPDVEEKVNGIIALLKK